ncbi:MAG TPA: porin [Polyangiales bacterium]
MFLRSSDDQFVLFPGGRLQVDGYAWKRDTEKMPNDTFLIRRARVEMFGWIGPWFGFNIAGDFALPPAGAADPIGQAWQNTTDDYVMIAPFKNLAMLQVGQFDAPFTLENRTSDKYFDFMERSLTVRAFGIPTNKEVGSMIHGVLPNSIAYYSLGVFNGDGQNFKNVDADFDLMGRAWISPAALANLSALEGAEIGASFWAGKRGATGLPLSPLTTQGGFAFSELKGTSVPTAASATGKPLEVHQHGNLTAFALELNLPLVHRYGLRVEYVHKNQELGIDDISQISSGKLTPLSTAKRSGWSAYGELWWWAVGDDTIIGAPGLQLPPRLKAFSTETPRHGLMFAARLERLDTQLTSNMPLGVASVGTNATSGETAVTSFEVGVNYWYSKRFRATLNYVHNHFDGTSQGIKNAVAKNGSSGEDEFLARLAVAL